MSLTSTLRASCVDSWGPKVSHPSSAPYDVSPSKRILSVRGVTVKMSKNTAVKSRLNNVNAKAKNVKPFLPLQPQPPGPNKRGRTENQSAPPAKKKKLVPAKVVAAQQTQRLKLPGMNESMGYADDDHEDEEAEEDDPDIVDDEEQEDQYNEPEESKVVRIAVSVAPAPKR